jgi:hypothetical protein
VAITRGGLAAMSDDHGHRRQDGHEAQQDSRPERAVVAYGRGVRTALRNNATAYGFSISITAAYGLVVGTQGSAKAIDTVAFALGAAIAFVVVGAASMALFPRAGMQEGEQTAMLSGGIDLLSVVAAVAAAVGFSRLGGFAVWPLTALGTVTVYLLVGGLDVLIACAVMNRSSVDRSQ